MPATRQKLTSACYSRPGRMMCKGTRGKYHGRYGYDSAPEFGVLIRVVSQGLGDPLSYQTLRPACIPPFVSLTVSQGCQLPQEKKMFCAFNKGLVQFIK